VDSSREEGVHVKNIGSVMVVVVVGSVVVVGVGMEHGSEGVGPERVTEWISAAEESSEEIKGVCGGV
jgi:hypothetical protein